MSTILEPLVERLRAIPSSLWEDIARDAGCAKSLPRKLAARDRTNPRVLTLEPLINYFSDIDAGRRALPCAASIVASHDRAPTGDRKPD
jgi:hypothetical protein